MFGNKPRCLACLADAFDEHLALLRIADEENFDIIQLQAGLSKFLVKMLVSCGHIGNSKIVSMIGNGNSNAVSVLWIF